MKKNLLFCLVILLAGIVLFNACTEEDDDDDDNADDQIVGEPAVDSLNEDPDDDDDDDSGDDDDDYDLPTPDPNPSAKADAFRLFYDERTRRTALSMNRFTMAGDAAWANAFLAVAIAREGNDYEVVFGPEGNNRFGYAAFSTLKLYQALGGRDLELSLIRMFGGIVFNEAVPGHPGLTTREALPGWTRVMDGVGDNILRTRWGVPVVPPVTYSAELEQEILDTFFDGVNFTYRENPENFLFNFKSIHELTTFAITYVFDELHRPTPFMRVSDCCSSFMVSQKGIWSGAYWGNHNSRDNFTDYALGFIAAMEVEKAEGLPEDLTQAASQAADAARRIGDNIIEHDSILMTVDEWHDYETLRPAGETNPDGEQEWQDLGSLASCQAAYLAQAISSEGLSIPPPELSLPGSIEVEGLRKFFNDLGIELPMPVRVCRGIDDAYIGVTWSDLLAFKILGIPWYEVADMLSVVFPDLFSSLFGSMMDDFYELELGMVALCYYAQVQEDEELLDQTKLTLSNLIEVQRILVNLVYKIADDPTLRAQAETAVGPEEYARQLAKSNELLYAAAIFARMFNIASPLEDLEGFVPGDQRTAYVEDQLDMPDTTYEPMLTDQQIYEAVEARVEGRRDRAPWIIDRYRDRFGDTPPVRLNQAGDGYESIGVDDQWHSTENSRHVWFKDYFLWFESYMCVHAPETLDCAWAKIGCLPADLNDSGQVDQDDQAIFDEIWGRLGPGTACTEANDQCDGADLDQSGTLGSEDQEFMTAAEGCRV